MPIPTRSYEDIFLQYSAAMSWMEELGIKLSAGRTAHYKRVIGRWKDMYMTATPVQAQEVYADFISSMFEVNAFITVHKAFKNSPIAQITSIIQKLEKGVNGPMNAVSETSDSSTARNFLFEATIAAKSHRPDRGVEAILNAKSDTGIQIDGKKIWIECKRVTTIRKIEGNVRKAVKQLAVIFAGEVGSGHRGMVALDISKILNQGDKIYFAKNDDELLASISTIMDDFINKYCPIWERIYGDGQRKIIGTIINFSFMATSQSRNLVVYASQMALSPRQGAAKSDVLIQKRLVTLLSSND